MSTRSPLSSTANQPSLNRKLKIDVHHRDVPVVEADENRDDLLTAEPFPQELLHQDEFTHLDGLPPAEQVRSRTRLPRSWNCENNVAIYKVRLTVQKRCLDKAWAINDKAAQDESYIDNLKLLLRSARTSYEKVTTVIHEFSWNKNYLLYVKDMKTCTKSMTKPGAACPMSHCCTRSDFVCLFVFFFSRLLSGFNGDNSQS